MKRYVLIRYTFMFDPSETFQHKSDVDKLLTDAFDSRGMEAQNVDVVSGAVGEGIILIKKKEMIEIPQQQNNLLPESKEPVGRPKTMKGIVKELTQHIAKPQERDFKKGVLLKRKGYLKR